MITKIPSLKNKNRNNKYSKLRRKDSFLSKSKNIREVKHFVGDEDEFFQE